MGRYRDTICCIIVYCVPFQHIVIRCEINAPIVEFTLLSVNILSFEFDKSSIPVKPFDFAVCCG